MESNSQVTQLVDHLFRRESGKMIAVLSRLLGLSHLETAEDIVQDALLQAMSTWGFNGIPENPEAWLYRVARNKAIDRIRREKKFREILPQIKEEQSESDSELALQPLFLDNEIQDSQLRMMFACCHPSIPQPSQVATILKTLCGLSTKEIANAFLTTEETIQKRIYRAREKMAAEKISLDMPEGNECRERTDAILQSLYLLFNEGYLPSQHDNATREELCGEAMRLCHLLTKNPLTRFPRTHALLALFCFQASRLGTRTNDQGQIILLKYQDRKKWNHLLIQQGYSCLEAAAEPFEISTYHLEAAIASLHAASKEFESTDWKSIYTMYEKLYQFNPSPIVAMNKAVAALYAFNPDKALEEMIAIDSLQRNHLYHACLGEIYLEIGNVSQAKQHFEKALQLTASASGQQLLRDKIASCKS